MPRAVAWNSVELMMPNAAPRKDRLIVLSAGTPTSIISCAAAASVLSTNSMSICSGNSWNSTRPSAMITTAAVSVIRYAPIRRRRLRAP